MLEAQKIAIKVYANQDDSTGCPKKTSKLLKTPIVRISMA